MKLAVPDMISPSYFPALAAVELGFFQREGLDVTHDLRAPANRCYEDLRDGHVDFVGASAHAALAAFPDWQGVKLLCAQGQGMYWFLVMRTDLGAARGDLSVVRGRRIAAAPWVEMGLRRMLMAAGIDPLADKVDIAPLPGSVALKVNTGVTVAEALADQRIDGFWANGMGAEIAVRRGVGTVVIDTRRGDGPPGCFDYTAATVATTDRLIAAAPQAAAGAIRAIVATQAALRQDPSLATQVGRKLFPPLQAELIAELVARDAPYYDPSLSEPFVSAMNRFARDLGVLSAEVPYQQVVATRFSHLWKPQALYQVPSATEYSGSFPDPSSAPR
ncbi:ABC transporter substrate-binding protein [Rhodopila sp.]|uniref:ABC transporter substrate-binding protein n=1 Tax=Rhodopila sp. TaxID=2480087 RepID=UPI003D0F21B5